MISFFLAFASIMGAILNVKQRKSGFLVWIIANIGWIIIDFHAKIYGQVIFFIFLTILSIWGLYSWHKKGLPW